MIEFSNNRLQVDTDYTGVFDVYFSQEIRFIGQLQSSITNVDLYAWLANFQYFEGNERLIMDERC